MLIKICSALSKYSLNLFESFKELDGDQELGQFKEIYELDDLKKFEDLLSNLLDLNCTDLPEVKQLF